VAIGSPVSLVTGLGVVRAYDRPVLAGNIRRAVLGAAMALSVAAVLSGCGQGDTPAAASLHKVPLAPGGKVVWQARRCDKGSNPYCSVQFVITGARYASSAALRTAQRATLRHAGWTEARGDTDAERSATSPGGKLRMTVATAFNDLVSAEEGTIDRAPGVMRALSRQLFSRTPALSATLETGSS
jgi:hypothetical protein